MDAKTVLKRTILFAMQAPVIGRAVIGYYDRTQVFRGWNREHPYDRAHGVRTSGASPAFVLGSDHPYGAAQPSIIRQALATIPDTKDCHFVDLGCGKGRPLLIATEFDFHCITGVELSATLCDIARRNAAVFLRSYPDRTPIEIITGDAPGHKLPAGNLVIFLYHPFDRSGTLKLLDNIEASQRAKPRDLYVVYYNPVWADLFDASTVLERRYAVQLPYDVSEVGYGPDASDGVIIWQNRGNTHPLPPGDPSAPIKIIAPGWLAAVAMQA